MSVGSGDSLMGSSFVVDNRGLFAFSSSTSFVTVNSFGIINLN